MNKENTDMDKYGDEQHRELVQVAMNFMESEEMRAHMQTAAGRPSHRGCLKLIAESRASLEEKASTLEKIAKQYPQVANEFCDPAEMANQARAALQEMKNVPHGSVFILSEFWIDREIEWNDDEFLGDYAKKYSKPFPSFEKAALKIKHELEELYGDDDEGVPSDDDACWYEISRWDLDEKGNLYEAITWFLSYTGVIWGYDGNPDPDHRKELRKLHNDDMAFFHGHGGGFNMPTPFAVGDIITIDMRPYTDVFYAVITSTRDGRDCCDPTILYFNKRGQFDFGALKHLSFKMPTFSPLLRATRYDGELPDWMPPLDLITHSLKKDSSLGEKLFDIDGYYKDPDRNFDYLLEKWLGYETMEITFP